MATKETKISTDLFNAIEQYFNSDFNDPTIKEQRKALFYTCKAGISQKRQKLTYNAAKAEQYKYQQNNDKQLATLYNPPKPPPSNFENVKQHFYETIGIEKVRQWENKNKLKPTYSNQLLDILTILLDFWANDSESVKIGQNNVNRAYIQELLWDKSSQFYCFVNDKIQEYHNDITNIKGFTQAILYNTALEHNIHHDQDVNLFSIRETFAECKSKQREQKELQQAEHEQQTKSQNISNIMQHLTEKTSPFHEIYRNQPISIETWDKYIVKYKLDIIPPYLEEWEKMLKDAENRQSQGEIAYENFQVDYTLNKRWSFDFKFFVSINKNKENVNHDPQ
ncbi:MAG: hypothetical protein FWG64_00870 [Firmicutes bacterium]|nr:hypothetical protein [Bacillota bacterium]